MPIIIDGLDNPHAIEQTVAAIKAMTTNRSAACTDKRHGDCTPYEGRRRGCECQCHQPKR